MLPPYVQAVISALSGIVSLIAVVNLVHSRRKERDEAKERHDTEVKLRERERIENDARLKAIEASLQEVKRNQEEQGRRIDSHNGYAEMFAEHTKDNAKITETIGEMREDLAYVKGKLESFA